MYPACDAFRQAKRMFPMVTVQGNSMPTLPSAVLGVNKYQPTSYLWLQYAGPGTNNGFAAATKFVP